MDILKRYQTVGFLCLLTYVAIGQQSKGDYKHPNPSQKNTHQDSLALKRDASTTPNAALPKERKKTPKPLGNYKHPYGLH